ncbi:leucine-rich repeat-containing protein 72 isoform X2 [Astyanax mexicanus]|uniref:leucine-rich repeat-containing protein 72 isoform X2 n=1 Tax=Astyanax mexicanus TaxID=7994 RepID=UPI0020CAA7C1|nr:leucine-rich repeat-containing protein 72 isoform X2 [Astyanax mexicanus]
MEESGSPMCRPSKDLHISELYLAKRGLSAIPDLSKFKQLRYVWLNNNKIKNLNGSVFNCCIAELYLQNNEITTISGALRHLTCLRVLLLHNNQLKNLEETVAELRHTHCLQTVNFFLNPFTQDPEYREYVIHHLPSVQILDRKEVRQEERRHAFRLFCSERLRVLDTLAFGRRAVTPPVGRKITQDMVKLRGYLQRSCGFHASTGQSCLGQHRTMFPLNCPSEYKSVLQFSIMDWCSMRTTQQSPLEEEGPTALNILTVKFR